MICTDYDDETPLGDCCDECGKAGEKLIGCGQCEMRFCEEHHENLVTDKGCAYCAHSESAEELVGRLGVA